MSPQWIQWLRQTRYDAPSIVEQQQDLVRQAQLRQLAAAADERWARIPSYRDPPKLQQPQPAMEPRDQGGYGNRIEDDVMKAKGEGAEGVRSMVAGQEELAAEAENQSAPQAYSRSEGEKSSRKKKGKKLENPWTKAGGGDNWQPQTWSPGVSPRQ
ncbi:MAG: hypothetical protein M1820_003365 [Bogoriella megaspora]|nr:MAG: hypothetical protein M1820_003365 [Bogoriella megaspora]